MKTRPSLTEDGIAFAGNPRDEAPSSDHAPTVFSGSSVNPTERRRVAVTFPTADRAVLVALVLLGTGLLCSLIYPVAGALLFAAVLAGALYPQFEWLTRRLGGRPLLASLFLTIGVSLLLAIPTVWLAVTMGGGAMTGLASVDRALRGGGGVPALIRLLPKPIRPRAQEAIDSVPGATAQIEDAADKSSGQTANAMTIGLIATTKLVIDFALMMIAFFFLLVDGGALVAWIAAVAPLPASQILEILGNFRRVSVAVVVSSLGTAGVQAVTALGGYLAAGVPKPVFFTVATFLVAFIPAVGATAVVLCAAGLLLFTGHTKEALYLALWGVFVVSTIDNLLKPWLLKGRMEIHGGLIFFSLVGGLATFGPMGLIAGPLILSFFLAAVRLSRNDPAAGSAGTPRS